METFNDNPWGSIPDHIINIESKLEKSTTNLLDNFLSIDPAYWRPHLANDTHTFIKYLNTKFDGFYEE